MITCLSGVALNVVLQTGVYDNINIFNRIDFNDCLAVFQVNVGRLGVIHKKDGVFHCFHTEIIPFVGFEFAFSESGFAGTA